MNQSESRGVKRSQEELRGVKKRQEKFREIRLVSLKITRGKLRSKVD